MASLPLRLAACALAGTLLGCAAPDAPRAGPDPLDARAGVPPLRHASAIPAPTPLPDLADWAERNRNVERIGGWRAYSREAAAAAAAASAPSGAPR